MNELLKLLKALLPGNSETTYKGIVALLGIGDKELGEESDENTVTPTDIVKSLRELGYNPVLPGQKKAEDPTKKSATPFAYEQEPVTPADEKKEDAPNPQKKAMEAFYQMRFGDKAEAIKSILSDVIGGDHQQVLYEQNAAFAKYIRKGERYLDGNEMKLLHRQFFPEEHVVKAIVEDGFDVATIKATQVEAQGELGGIAVPPQRQSEVETRLPGYTAVRGNGARVIQLVNTNSIEIPQWRSTDVNEQFIGEIRGEWGNETKAPGEQNFKLDLVPVFANIYTYKVPFSQSLVEDASNLVALLMQDISLTAAMDEDNAFLTGDGAGKPEGILPDGLNDHGLTEVNSGDASVLLADGIKSLKRGIASQYRPNAIFVANSDTYGDIEVMRDDSGATAGTGQYLFPDLSNEDMLLGRKAVEQESMPDVAANAYPILLAWMMGYDIVERLGMTIQRFQDSNTGPNKVEFHVRKRIGGKLEKPWMFAVQKVAA